MTHDHHDHPDHRAHAPGPLILCAGPEVPDPGAWADALPRLIPDRPSQLVSTPSGLPQALDAHDPAAPVTVIPLSTSRHPQTIADCARALRWSRDHDARRVRLAAPLADATSTVSALRAAIRRHVPSGATVLVASTTLDPFADAELYRRARLARQYGGAPVEVAFEGAGADPDLDAGLARCRALGASEVVVLRGDLLLRADGHRSGHHPAWGLPALGALIAARASAAEHLDEGHGDDGVDAALMADHDHGYAHSHGDEDHGHPHHHHHHGHGHHAHHAHHHHHHGHAHDHGGARDHGHPHGGEGRGDARHHPHPEGGEAR